MPTNILRNRPRPASPPPAAAVGRSDLVLVTIGRVAIRARLLDTPTARRMAAALPLHAAVEPWGEALHFEVPVESGRERYARLNAAPGDILFWSNESRVLIVYGPTPISRAGELRLPAPCNVWAHALDDLTALRTVRPSEKVTIARLDIGRDGR